MNPQHGNSDLGMKSQRGFLLITVLLILVLLMVMGVSFTGMALWGLDQARLQRD